MSKNCFLLIMLLSVSILMPGTAYGSVSCQISPDDINISSEDSLFFSNANVSIDEIMDWGDKMTELSVSSSKNNNSFRYNAFFLPDIPDDTRLFKYRADILPDGISSSYAELTDIDDVSAEQDSSVAAAQECQKDGKISAIKVMNDQSEYGIFFCEDYSEVAKHTTVRKYQNLGQLTIITILYQYLNDGDPDCDYFFIKSDIRMTNADDSKTETKWRNSEFIINYNLNATYYQTDSFNAYSGAFTPQTSPNFITSDKCITNLFLNILDVPSLMSSLFGHSVTVHSIDNKNISWATKCGYFSREAENTLEVQSASEIIGKQPSINDTGWYVLAKVGINADYGWSAYGGFIKEPLVSSEWGHYILIRKSL